MVKVRCFAAARQAAGRAEFDLPCSRELTIDEFWAAVTAEAPGLSAVRGSVRLARNLEYFSEGSIRPGDEVAIIPPVSGG